MNTQNMRIMREDLRTGERTVVARYSDITTSTAHAFMVAAAQAEANARDDIRNVALGGGGSLSGHSWAMLMLTPQGAVVKFTQEWPA